MKYNIFYHIATINNYEKIVIEQINRLDKSGLLNQSNLFLGIVGPHAKELNNKLSCFDILYINNKLEVGEIPTINQILNFGKQTNGQILYIHTKGINHLNKQKRIYCNDWRNLMEYWTIDRWQDCIEALKFYDVCGINLHESPKLHFSGNFWWANSDYIKTLKPIESSNRYDAEFWICSNPSVNAKCLYESGIDHYNKPYPKDIYDKTV
jgi:hypothetical protein